MSTTSRESREFYPPAQFIKSLGDRYGLIRRKQVEEHPLFPIQWLDLTPLKLNVSFFTPFATATRLNGYSNITAEHIDALLTDVRERARSNQDAFTVLVLGGKVQALPDGILARLKSARIAIIDKTVIDAVNQAAEDGLEQIAVWKILVKPLVRHLGPEALSPYLVGRPAFGGRFFGRAESLAGTVSGKFGGNFTILGNRRIGKTSLLREVKQRLLRDNPNLITADIYGSKFNSTTGVLYELLEHLRPKLAERAIDTPEIMDNFPAHVAWIPEKQDQDVVVFIDELDRILDFDERQNYQLMHLLRATFEHERCRVFFAGFRRVMEARRRNDTPLYNFTNPVPLKGLTTKETAMMVQQPLGLLGIEVKDEVARTIAQQTGGQPELVQLCCQYILQYATANGGVAPSANTLINGLFEDERFKETVWGTFISNTNPHEQLLCFLLILKAHREGKPFAEFDFSLRDFDDVLRSAQLDLNLEKISVLESNLKIAGVIAGEEKKGRYHLAVPQIGNYAVAKDLDWLISKAKSDLERGTARLHELWSEPTATVS